MEFVDVRTTWLQGLLERSERLNVEVNALVADGKLDPSTLLATELFYLLGYIGSAEEILKSASRALDPNTDTELEEAF